MANNRRVDPAIIAALIGVLGTVCVTVITLLAPNFIPRAETPQPTVPVQPTFTVPPTATITDTPVPTDTVPAGDPTSTPAPDTPTPQPTFTPVPPAIGLDWANDCISILWRPYPATVATTANTNGCFVDPINFTDPVNLIFAEVIDNVGRLKFSVNRSFDSPQVYGLFAQIPANGTVRIDTLLTRAQDGEIWMGVFAEPTISSQGLVAVLPGGNNVRQRALIQRKMPELTELHRLESLSDDPTQDPPRYSIVFELSNGEVRIQKLGDTEFSAVPLGSAQPWLFVGYQVAAGNNRMDAEFLNLLVQGQ
jgi:hypothetical protein